MMSKVKANSPAQNPEYQLTMLTQPRDDEAEDDESSGGDGEDYEHVFVLFGVQHCFPPVCEYLGSETIFSMAC